MLTKLFNLCFKRNVVVTGGTLVNATVKGILFVTTLSTATKFSMEWNGVADTSLLTQQDRLLLTCNNSLLVDVFWVSNESDSNALHDILANNPLVTRVSKMQRNTFKI